MDNKGKLKILHIITTLQKGGAERIVIDICNEIRKNHSDKIETVIATLIDKNDYKNLSNEIRIVNVNSWVNLSFLKTPKANIEELQNLIYEYNPDIIHSHLFVDEIVSRFYLFQGIKYFTHLHGYDFKYERFNLKTLFNKFKLISYLERNWLIEKYTQCDNNFITISDYSKNEIRRMLPDKLKNIFLLNNAIDFNKFFCNKQRSIYGKDSFKLISVGSLRSLKNHPFLIDVVNILLEKKINVNLDIYGKGENKNILQNKIDSLNLSTKIKLKGSVDNIEDILPLYDLYVHSSFSESFGLTSLEAMAAGLPVVTLDGKGNRDIVINDLNGFIITDSNPYVFAEKVLNILTNQELYSKLSRNALEFAGNFDIKEYCIKLINLYEFALRK